MKLPRGLLNDTQIQYLSEAAGMITPFATGERRPGKISYGVTSFGYDMRVADEWVRLVPPEDGILDPKVSTQFESMNRPRYLLKPGHFVLCRSVETFKIPDFVKGIVTGKSTYARFGINCLCTPLEPGWEGTVTIELANVARIPVWIYANEGIAQVEFYAADRPAITYADKAGKYQGQRNVTVGRVD